MQRFFACLFFSVLTISSTAAEAAWWSAATAAYGRGLGYEPGHTIVRIEELDPDGKVQSTESGEIRTHRAEGKLVSTVIRAQKNGKDVTADWQKRYNRSSQDDRGGPPAGFDATPFDPGWASADVSWRLGRLASGGAALPDLLLLGLSAEAEALPGAFLGLKAANLLDEAYVENVGFPMPGLALTASLRLVR